jgi:hypothetical protein
MTKLMVAFRSFANAPTNRAENKNLHGSDLLVIWQHWTLLFPTTFTGQCCFRRLSLDKVVSDDFTGVLFPTTLLGSVVSDDFHWTLLFPTTFTGQCCFRRLSLDSVVSDDFHGPCYTACLSQWPSES